MFKRYPTIHDHIGKTNRLVKKSIIAYIHVETVVRA